MARRRSERATGRRGALELRARDELTLQAAIELVERLARAGESVDAPCSFAGIEARLVAGALRGAQAWSWGLSGGFTGRHAPHTCEFDNLNWLRERLFLAPEPLAAAVVLRWRVPRFQMLVTARVEGATTLDEHWIACDERRRRALALELADVVSRMHALHFVHGALDPRRVLVRAEASGGNLWLTDCWRGGERLQRRGASDDLASLLVRAPEWLGAPLQREFLAAYLAGRERQGRPERHPRRFLERVARARRKLVTSLARSGVTALVLDWDVD